MLTPAMPGGSIARAAADQDVVLPVDGAFELEGRGFGHGRGMSQWGSQGAAVSGVGYEEILATYYPGTDLVTSDDADPKLKVHITDLTGRLRVRPADDLRVQSRKDARTLPRKKAGDTVSTWRVSEIGGKPGKLRLEARAGGSWHRIQVEGTKNLASPVRFRGGDNQVRIKVGGSEERDYRGQIYAHSDRHTGNVFRVVNKVGMQSYLRSVVPSESFPTWEPAALRAQSVAARTYALWRARNVKLGFADICDTTACQVYHGKSRLDGRGNLTRIWEAASTDDAIDHTRARMLRFDGEPALTEFSASNGGHSTAGDKAYLVARADEWDGVVPNNAHAWTAKLKVSTVEKAFPEVGRVEALEVRRRDGNGPWGGRVLTVRVLGSADSVDVNGFRFASIVNLRHSWWRAVDAEPVVIETPPTTPETEVLPEELPPLLPPAPEQSETDPDPAPLAPPAEPEEDSEEESEEESEESEEESEVDADQESGADPAEDLSTDPPGP